MDLQKQKCQLGSCLDQQDRGASGFSRDSSHGKPGKKIYCRGFQRALDLEYHPQGHPDRKSPEGAPEPAGARTRTTARHRRVTKIEPTSTRAAHPARNLPETAPDERGTSSSVKELINSVADIPSVSSLHCWRPAQHHGHDPRAELRGTQARHPHRPRSSRVATPWWLCHLKQRCWHHLPIAVVRQSSLRN